MRRLQVSVFLLSFLTITFGCATQQKQAKEEIQPAGIDLYVSVDGNDSWSGKLADPAQGGADGPFATIERARDEIRSLKRGGTLLEPVTVHVRDGHYQLSEPLTFTAQDSGTADCPVTYAAYPGESPVICGGRKITEWYRGLGGVWNAEVPEVKEGDWVFRQLFVNGERRQRARIPNEGFFQADGDISLGPPAQFNYRDKDIQPLWAGRGDVEIVALQKWAEFRMQIRGIDPVKREVTLSGKCAPSNREKNARYWVENAAEALDAPGEWYLDRRTAVVSYKPMAGESLSDFEAAVPVIGTLVRLDGGEAGEEPVSYIRFEGLEFQHASWSLPESGYTDLQAAHDIPAAFEANNARFCSVERCRFAHLGRYAVQFANGSKYCRLVGSEMTDLGAGGVKIGETGRPANPDKVTSGILVAHNHIHNIGIVYPAAVGVWIGNNSDIHVAHNHIHDTYYTGISVGWTWGYNENNNTGNNIVEYNHVHDIGRGMLSDMGGIYTLGIQQGSAIRNNIFHDVTSYGYGGWGIYTDEGSSHIVIENNLAYRCKSANFHQHYGRENIIRNNIFAFGKEYQIMRTRMEDHLSFIFEQNIVYWDSGELLGSNWKDDKYEMDHNMYWDTRGKDFKFSQWTFEEWQQRGMDTHSFIMDPIFVNPSENNFELKPGTPVWRIGFKPIDFSTVGPDPTILR